MEGYHQQQYKRLFDHLDENGDRKISASELQQCVHMIGKDMSLDEAEAAVAAYDSDNDGLLDFDDFLRLVEDGGTEEEKANEMKEAFRMYEMEGCGCITPESLKRMLDRLGEKRTVDECRGMIARYDINGDGLLNFDEFVIMMRC
ncbi:putative calcium-binding protein CML19 [Lycium ferocissimum]|uniref:putative calcium-binding protein CML19 n=1 Tax=Lycium ferocissimum TaxID=112874 RepID=UPI0028166FEE|nr:putative calcium-binding protein CML19 [Lycium ferocissimum]